MKTSMLINKLQKLQSLYGNLEVVVAGVFTGGAHKFDVCPPSDYYDPQEVLMMNATDVQEKFVIDQV